MANPGKFKLTSNTGPWIVIDTVRRRYRVCNNSSSANIQVFYGDSGQSKITIFPGCCIDVVGKKLRVLRTSTNSTVLGTYEEV